MKLLLKVIIGTIILFSLNLFSANAECSEGVDNCLFGWNHASNTGSLWNKWTWLDPISGLGDSGFMMDVDNLLWSGSTFNWINGGRIKSFSKGALEQGDIEAVIDTIQRAPSTTQGGSFKISDLAGTPSNAASWWIWYDALPLSTRGITDANTDRMSFYVKTENMAANSTSTGITTGSGFHVGTYLCWDAGCSDGDTGGEGPGNQHYYHYLALNPGAWIHVELDQHPQHRETGSGAVLGNNPSNIESGKNYFEHVSRFYMEMSTAQTDLTTMYLDELQYYSTQDSAEPSQNDESITSVWVGNWRDDDYWEVGFSDNSFGEDNMDSTTWSTFEMRWSTGSITNANYSAATLIEPMFYTGSGYTDGSVGAFRRSSATERGAWTRFELPDEVETEGNQIFFAIKDISIFGSGSGTISPWNGVDGHNAPTSNIRLIDYYVGPAPLNIETISLSSGEVNASYSVVVSATGGILPYTFSTVSSIPAGMVLSSSGVLSGTPTETGTFNIDIVVKDFNSPSTQVTQSLSLLIYQPEICNDNIDNDGNGQIDCADSSCSNVCTELLVDFGDSSANNIFHFENWNTVFKDKYTGYYNQGTTIDTGTNMDYNYQGVSGPSIELEEGDKILFNWYNDTSSLITFSPRVSFIDNDRFNSDTVGPWYTMTQLPLGAGEYGVSEYEITSASAGNYTLVNANVNYSHTSELILDKISLIDLSGTGVIATVAPTLSDSTPDGEQLAGMINTHLTLVTDRNATCKYSTTANTGYDSMSNTFTTSGAKSHSINISGLTDGGSYNYYVRCEDEDANRNISDHIISFSIATPSSDYACSGGCSELLVDFGDSAMNNTFNIDDWDTVFNDKYTDYYNQGMTIVTGNSGEYNYQGVLGPSMTFSERDKILVRWYNDGSSTINFTPRMSFTDNDRFVSDTVGIWYSLSSGMIKPGEYGVTEYEITSGSEGDYTFINTNVNYDHNKDLILDKIFIVEGDTTAPVLSDGAPVGEQESGTTNVNLILTTDENSTCRYATTGGTSYGAMTDTFSTTGSTSHSTNIIGLADGVSYIYYVRCIDDSTNENTSDYQLSFSVATPPVTISTKTIGGGSGGWGSGISQSVKNEDSTGYEGSATKKYHSSIRIVKKIEKRIDQLIGLKNKTTDNQVIRHRNLFIQAVEKYVQAMKDKKQIKKYRGEVGDSFQLFYKELKNKAVIDARINVKTQSYENTLVNKVGKKLDKLIRQSNKEDNEKVQEYKGELLSSLDLYITVKQKKEPGIAQKKELQILFNSFKKSYKIFLKELKA